MPTAPEDPRAAPGPAAPSLPAYLLGSVLLFSLVGCPLIDFLAGDWEGYGKAALKGACLGLLFGLLMYPFDRWLERRKAGKPGGSP